MLAGTQKTPLPQAPSALHEALLQTDYPLINSVFALSGILSIILLYRGVDLALDYFFPEDTPTKIGVVFALFAVSALVSYFVGAFLLHYHTFKIRGGGTWSNFFFRAGDGGAVDRPTSVSAAQGKAGAVMHVAASPRSLHSVVDMRGGGAAPPLGAVAASSRGSSRRQATSRAPQQQRHQTEQALQQQTRMHIERLVFP